MRCEQPRDGVDFLVELLQIGRFTLYKGRYVLMHILKTKAILFATGLSMKKNDIIVCLCTSVQIPNYMLMCLLMNQIPVVLKGISAGLSRESTVCICYDR